ncbi:hypothetical protein ACIQWA_02980 [Kitasatospora sp. NPDC098652]|uniref:hypothetical protein n=1 Tax=Kitasatospora sp. NPDC098652 TaxID=3364095 RepID=UPI0037F9682C
MITVGSFLLAGAVGLAIPGDISPAADTLVFVLVFLAISTGGFSIAAGWLRVRS